MRESERERERERAREGEREREQERERGTLNTAQEVAYAEACDMRERLWQRMR